MPGRAGIRSACVPFPGPACAGMTNGIRSRRIAPSRPRAPLSMGCLPPSRPLPSAKGSRFGSPGNGEDFRRRPSRRSVGNPGPCPESWGFHPRAGRPQGCPPGPRGRSRGWSSQRLSPTPSGSSTSGDPCRSFPIQRDSRRGENPRLDGTGWPVPARARHAVPPVSGGLYARPLRQTNGMKPLISGTVILPRPLP